MSRFNQIVVASLVPGFGGAREEFTLRERFLATRIVFAAIAALVLVGGGLADLGYTLAGIPLPVVTLPLTGWLVWRLLGSMHAASWAVGYRDCRCDHGLCEECREEAAAAEACS